MICAYIPEYKNVKTRKPDGIISFFPGIETLGETVFAVSTLPGIATGTKKSF
jgi:hypothetical protein